MGYSSITKVKDKNNKELINIELIRGDTLRLIIEIKANG